MTPGGVWSELGLQTDKIKNLHFRQGGRSRAEMEESVYGGPCLPLGCSGWAPWGRWRGW